MSRLTRTLRHRRDAVRTQRAIDRAVAATGDPGLRDELLEIAQRNGGLYGR